MSKLQNDNHNVDTRLSSVTKTLDDGVQTVEEILEARKAFVGEAESLTVKLQEHEKQLLDWLEVYDDEVKGELVKAKVRLTH